MPRLFGGNPIEQIIEKATQETNLKEDVQFMYEICDLVNATPDGHKDAFKCIIKRLQNSNPRVQFLSLCLLDILVMNCGKKIHLEVCSRDFISLCKTLMSKSNPRVQDKLKFCLAKWAANEFKTDSQLAIVENFIKACECAGHSFDVEEPTLDSADMKPQANRTSTSPHHQKQEEDDLAKAIMLSLNDNKMRNSHTTIYPSMVDGPVDPPAPSESIVQPKSRELRKVRALYDFEAAEENELSFKAGEVIIVLEDRDPNWWNGSNHRGEGLFPANFVTSDLEATPPEETVSVIETPQVNQVTQIEEAKIDSLLQMLDDADPTTLQRTEQDAKMEALEAECNLMTPLIDAELAKIDRRHASLSHLSRRLNDALAMYHHLLRQPQMPFAPPAMMPPQHIPQGIPQMPYYPPAPPLPMSGYPMMAHNMPQMAAPQHPNQQPPVMGSAATNGIPYQQ